MLHQIHRNKKNREGRAEGLIQVEIIRIVIILRLLVIIKQMQIIMTTKLTKEEKKKTA